MEAKICSEGSLQIVEGGPPDSARRRSHGGDASEGDTWVQGQGQAVRFGTPRVQKGLFRAGHLLDLGVRLAGPSRPSRSVHAEPWAIWSSGPGLAQSGQAPSRVARLLGWGVSQGRGP